MQSRCSITMCQLAVKKEANKLVPSSLAAMMHLKDPESFVSVSSLKSISNSTCSIARRRIASFNLLKLIDSSEWNLAHRRKSINFYILFVMTLKWISKIAVSHISIDAFHNLCSKDAFPSSDLVCQVFVAKFSSFHHFMFRLKLWTKDLTLCRNQLNKSISVLYLIDMQALINLLDRCLIRSYLSTCLFLLTFYEEMSNKMQVNVSLSFTRTLASFHQSFSIQKDQLMNSYKLINSLIALLL